MSPLLTSHTVYKYIEQKLTDGGQVLKYCLHGIRIFKCKALKNFNIVECCELKNYFFILFLTNMKKLKRFILPNIFNNLMENEIQYSFPSTFLVVNWR